MVVPRSRAASLTSISRPPSTTTFVASTTGSRFVSSSTFATEAIDASASPRKPSVAMAARSSSVRIFDVACRSKASIASSRTIPSPSSATPISLRPPSSISTLIRVAPASIEFSTSSLMTDAGRSTTSPAAIWFARLSGRICILFVDLSAIGRKSAS